MSECPPIKPDLIPTLMQHQGEVKGIGSEQVVDHQGSICVITFSVHIDRKVSIRVSVGREGVAR